MTTIAWDGHTLAADSQGLVQGNKAQVATKIWRVENPERVDSPLRLYHHIRGPIALLAIAGSLPHGLAVKRWFLDGAAPDAIDPDKFKGVNFARLVVIDDRGRRIRIYEGGEPDPLVTKEPFMAWGSGVDFATAAMHLGLPARQAVDVAHRFDPHTGPCTTVLTFEDQQ